MEEGKNNKSPKKNAIIIARVMTCLSDIFRAPFLSVITPDYDYNYSIFQRKRQERCPFCQFIR